uniref:Uncharacterized protein n=1 Tax=Glossina austeni TaxID=7395 RepID=A0A1A9UEW3_GLOAU
MADSALLYPQQCCVVSFALCSWLLILKTFTAWLVVFPKLLQVPRVGVTNYYLALQFLCTTLEFIVVVKYNCNIKKKSKMDKAFKSSKMAWVIASDYKSTYRKYTYIVNESSDKLTAVEEVCERHELNACTLKCQNCHLITQPRQKDTKMYQLFRMTLYLANPLKYFNSMTNEKVAMFDCSCNCKTSLINFTFCVFKTGHHNNSNNNKPNKSAINVRSGYVLTTIKALQQLVAITTLYNS